MSNRQLAKRHEGIELARVLGMLMICNLHVLGMGGVLGTVGLEWNEHYIIAYFLESFSFAAVNIYILVSGYVGLTSRVTFRKLLKLWLQIIFYTVLITAMFALTLPESVTGQEWFKAITPISHNQYWYMTCYFGLMVFSPLFNKAIQELTNKQLWGVLLGGMLAFSIIPTLFRQEYYGLQQGYSVLWLLFMYVFGATVRRLKLAERISLWLCLLGLLLSTGLTFIFFINFPSQEWTYNLPTVVLEAVFFFLLCLKVKVLPRGLSRVILAIAPLTLGVYLSHVHPLVFTKLIPLSATFVERPKWTVFTFRILLLTLLIFVLGIAIDYLRYLFTRLISKRI